MKTKVLIATFLLFLMPCMVPLASAQAPKEILVGGTICLSGRFTTMVGPFKKLAENNRKEAMKLLFS